jgi:hypothetical protein
MLVNVLPAWASDTPLVWWTRLDDMQASVHKSVKVVKLWVSNIAERVVSNPAIDVRVLHVIV